MSYATRRALRGLIAGSLLSGLVACGPATLVIEPGDGVDSVGSTAADDTSSAGPVDPAEAAEPPDCGLTSDLTDPWFTEGDEVAFSVSCAGALDTLDALIDGVGLPDGARFEDDRFTWATGPADGGRYDLTFSARDAAQPDQVPEAAAVTFWVADDPDLPGAVPPDPVDYVEEWGLPVVHVEIGDTIESYYKRADISLGGRTYAGTIKVRGASSSYYPKKSYTMEFDEVEIEVDAWGTSRDHLILLTTFDDNSYVRQKLVYDQWAYMAKWSDDQRLTPRTEFVVVYIDGVYQGLYVALDRPDNEFIRHMGFDDAGDLYKAVNHDANFYLTDTYGSSKDTLHDGYEKKEGDPEEDYGTLDELVAWTGGADAETLSMDAGDWFDRDEFMDWFLLVHYSLSEDSAGKNSYLYKDPADGRFRYVPWDFNHAWGQNWYTRRLDPDDINDYEGTNRIFWAFQSHPAAETALWERFSAMREPGGPFDPGWLTDTVDAYYDAIQPAAERDWARWQADYYTYSGWSGTRNSDDDWTDFEEEKDYLYRWLDARAAIYLEDHP